MSKRKSQSNEFVKLAVDSAVFGAGAAVMGSASQSVAGNPAAKSIVDATPTLYATKMLKRAGKGLL